MITDPSIIVDVYALPTVDNVCNQTLREVLSFPAFSLAHVTMASGNSSLLHRHQQMNEIYYILSGKGILFAGDRKYRIKKDTYTVIPSKTSHKLFNSGSKSLEHLVLAVPPFDAKDVSLVEGSPSFQRYSSPSAVEDNILQVAADGATLYELLSTAEQEILGVGMAVGYLPSGKCARSHLHRHTAEVYYVLSEGGWVRVGEERMRVKKGSVVPILPNKLHSLENDSRREMKVLCISSPPYAEEDFVLE